jgi:hypothetical protein
VAPPRLLFLYGPPGVGKLTVARELAALTGFKLFHNHLTVDLVESVFPRGTPRFAPLIVRFRREMLAEAAAAGVDLIFTYVYAHPDDAEDVAGLVESFRGAGGVVLFARLTCPPAVLLERVTAASRHAYRKIADAETLRRILAEKDVLSPVPHGQSVTVDTGAVEPAEAARRIAAHHALSLVPGPASI